MKLGILASGNLGLSTLKQINERYTIECIFTDKGSMDIISFSEKYNINLFVGNPRNGNAFNFIQTINIDVLISINYLFIIEEDIISLPKQLAFNIHGSLLPKYRGRTPHVWAIINNETETGVTAHLIDKGCDTGKIIEQIKIPIHNDSTGADILKAFENNYFPLVNSVLQSIKQNTISLSKQDESTATVFGKRTPADGCINWSWQKERIRNWVRAQSYPYPGAFTYYNSEKIIIDEITYCNTGFSDKMPNGLILSINPLQIKTPNGVIEITKHRAIKSDLKLGNSMMSD